MVKKTYHTSRFSVFYTKQKINLTWPHLLLIRYLNHPTELILMKNSITLGTISSWNKTKHQFSNLSLKTFSLKKNINEEVKRGNIN